MGPAEARSSVLTRICWIGIAVGGGLFVLPLSADEVLYRYEGDVVPYDPSAGWEIFQPCDDPCSESVNNGHFLLQWADAGSTVSYNLFIAQPPDSPPPTLWAEWQYRSDTPFPLHSFTCDGRFRVKYGGMSELVYVFGDAAFSASGDDWVIDLDINDFQTYRYESLDGINYRIAVDGLVFIEGARDNANGYHAIGFGGDGGCVLEDLPTLNEWDFIRYGTIAFSEQIVASNPPGGYLDPQVYTGIDRFTVTFDAPNYVYLEEITVEVTGGVAPAVLQTRRLDNGEPDVVEIVLDGPMPLGETTRFTFDDGQRANVIEYTLIEPPVPTVSQWGIVVMTLLVLTTGTLILNRNRRASIRSVPQA